MLTVTTDHKPMNESLESRLAKKSGIGFNLETLYRWFLFNLANHLCLRSSPLHSVEIRICRKISPSLYFVEPESEQRRASCTCGDKSGDN
jgi:hypothetical protein